MGQPCIKDFSRRGRGRTSSSIPAPPGPRGPDTWGLRGFLAAQSQEVSCLTSMHPIQQNQVGGRSSPPMSHPSRGASAGEQLSSRETGCSALGCLIAWSSLPRSGRSLALPLGSATQAVCPRGHVQCRPHGDMAGRRQACPCPRGAYSQPRPRDGGGTELGCSDCHHMV